MKATSIPFKGSALNDLITSYQTSPLKRVCHLSHQYTEDQASNTQTFGVSLNPHPNYRSNNFAKINWAYLCGHCQGPLSGFIDLCIYSPVNDTPLFMTHLSYVVSINIVQVSSILLLLGLFQLFQSLYHAMYILEYVCIYLQKYFWTQNS